MTTLIGKVKGELDIKRFYFNGKIEVKCPKCKSKIKHDFNEDYILYPCVNEKTDVSFYCDNCEEYYSVTAKVKSIEITLEFDEKKVIKQ